MILVAFSYFYLRQNADIYNNLRIYAWDVVGKVINFDIYLLLLFLLLI